MSSSVPTALFLLAGRPLPTWLNFNTPSGEETPAPSPSSSHSNTPSGEIRLSKEEYDTLTAARSELEHLKPKAQKVEELEQVWRDVESTLKSDVADDVREASTRRILARAGYNPEQIESYVKATFSESGTPAEQAENNLKEKVEEAQKTANEVRIRQLRETLDRSIDSSLDSDPDWSKLFSRFQTSRDEKSLKQARETIAGEIQERTLSLLRERRALTGQFQEAWIGEETAKSAKAVFAKYRTVIGDVSLLGRAPETDSGEDEFLSQTPIDKPHYKPGMKMGDAEKALRNFAIDSLSRAAVEAGTGGRSAV
jgi:hypothetical protein